jgi:hypothetical protein
MAKRLTPKIVHGGQEHHMSKVYVFPFSGCFFTSLAWEGKDPFRIPAQKSSHNSWSSHINNVTEQNGQDKVQQLPEMVCQDKGKQDLD